MSGTRWSKGRRWSCWRPVEAAAALPAAPAEDVDAVRPELAELRARLAATTDESRPDAVARRRKTGQRTARENIADLVDEGSFVEYGALALAAQRQRAPARRARQRQPRRRHRLRPRHRERRPVRRRARAHDGARLRLHRLRRHAGRHRPQEARPHARRWRASWRAAGRALRRGRRRAARTTPTCRSSPASTRRASSASPRSPGSPRASGIASGRCFAGNAALLGCCDVIIATENSNIGMGGPAMIEGGGLGMLHARGDRPDRRAERRTASSTCASPTRRRRSPSAKKYLGYLPGRGRDVERADQRRSATRCPRAAGARTRSAPIIETPRRRRLGARAPRATSALGIVTALARIEGRPVRASSRTTRTTSAAPSTPTPPTRRRASSSSATPSACRSSRSATRPASWSGPRRRRRRSCATSRACSSPPRASTVPFFTVVLRKGYGLGAQAMAGGHFHAPFFTVVVADRRVRRRWASRARCASA